MNSKQEALDGVRQGLERGFVSRGNRIPKHGRPEVTEDMLLCNYVPRVRRVRKTHPWGEWTEEDDERLRVMVMANFEHPLAWKTVAQHLLGGRFKAAEVRRRWHCYILPRMGKRGAWTPEETVALLRAMAACWDAQRRQVSAWTDVMGLLGTGRVQRHCRQRWLRLRRSLAGRLQMQIGDVTPRAVLEAGDILPDPLPAAADQEGEEEEEGEDEEEDEDGDGSGKDG